MLIKTIPYAVQIVKPIESGYASSFNSSPSDFKKGDMMHNIELVCTDTAKFKEANISPNNINSAVIDFESKLGGDYAVFYDGKTSSLRFATGVAGFLDVFIVKKRLRTILKNYYEQKNSNKFILDKPMNSNDLGNFIDRCKKSFSYVVPKIYLNNLLNDDKLPERIDRIGSGSQWFNRVD